MVLEKLNDQELNFTLLKLVQQERRLTCQILDYLKEVEARRLFAQRGYSSLFAYCTEYLGYSESAAQRRISSMRLIHEVPQVQEQVSSGELSLSNVAKAASFFRQEQKINERDYTPKEKASILNSLKGKTQKQAEVELVKISPKPFQSMDRERPVSSDITELRVSIDNETLAKLNRLRELKPGQSTPDLLNWMLSRCLKQVDPLRKQEKQNNKSKKPRPLRQFAPPLRRPLPKSLRHQVWSKAKGSCQFMDHQSGKICKSKTGLEIDHIQPLILGGNDQLNNLRLLCREHHKLHTLRSFPK